MSSAEDYFKKLIASLPKIAEQAVEALAKHGQSEAKATNLFKGNSATGLRVNIKINTISDHIREVLADKDYAYYVEYGNNQKGAYIYPVRAKALRFRMNGQIVFAKKVRTHPGVYFMKAAAQEVENNVGRITDIELKKWIMGAMI